VPALRSIAVVGASLAGVRAVETLRADGFSGSITLIGAESRAPYDRPPLSKEILRGEWQADKIQLRRDGYDGLALDLRLGRRAVELRSSERKLVLDDGANVAFDGLVIATGTEARRLPAGDGLDGVYVLRTLDDALALRAALERGPRVVIVGAGFIGLEVAASCRARGLTVTVVEPQPEPLASILGNQMGAVCAALHRDHGVDLRTGVAAERIEGAGRVERVVLTDGSTIAADVVVVGIGVTPATSWLAGSGVELDDGVSCDECCRTSVPGIVAAGDVARWYNPLFGERMRVEHWTNAAEQGAAAARTLLAGETGAQAFAPVPTFWSDQYGVKIQFGGRAIAGSEVHVAHEKPGDRRFVALYRAEDRVAGVLAFKRSAQFVRYCGLIERRASWGEALAATNS
jgi:NADPH-dependent 2,4-dienoyl-CoA reductase/sulfur reductase-like enzyme